MATEGQGCPAIFVVDVDDPFYSFHLTCDLDEGHPASSAPVDLHHDEVHDLWWAKEVTW